MLNEEKQQIFLAFCSAESKSPISLLPIDLLRFHLWNYIKGNKFYEKYLIPRRPSRDFQNVAQTLKYIYPRFWEDTAKPLQKEYSMLNNRKIKLDNIPEIVQSEEYKHASEQFTRCHDLQKKREKVYKEEFGDSIRRHEEEERKNTKKSRHG
jgi:hypothetical protein